MSATERGDGMVDDWQPRAGEMHPVDEAFYKLAVKERDYERVKVDRLEAQLAGAVETLRTARDELSAALPQSDQVLREYAEDAVEAITAKLAAWGQSHG